MLTAEQIAQLKEEGHLSLIDDEILFPCPQPDPKAVKRYLFLLQNFVTPVEAETIKAIIADSTEEQKV